MALEEHCDYSGTFGTTFCIDTELWLDASSAAMFSCFTVSRLFLSHLFIFQSWPAAVAEENKEPNALTTQYNTVRNMPLSAPLPTLGASWIITLDPFPKENQGLQAQTPWQALSAPKKLTYTHKLVLFMMQSEAAITRPCGCVWEHKSEVTQRWGGRHGAHTHTKTLSVWYKPTLWLCQRIWKADRTANTHHHTLTLTKWHRQTPYCPGRHTHAHTRLVLCLLRFVVISLWPAPMWFPPLAPRRERGLTAGPRHSLVLFCMDEVEGGGIMPFHVSECRHDATYLNGEKCSGNKQKAHWSQPKGNKADVRTRRRFVLRRRQHKVFNISLFYCMLPHWCCCYHKSFLKPLHLSMWTCRLCHFALTV